MSYELEQVMPQVISTGLLDSLFTALAPDGNASASGAQSGDTVPVAGLTNIPCNSAVQSNLGIAPTEIRELQDILAKAPRHVMLDAYYPALAEGWREGWQANVQYPDGTITLYLIIGVECDSQLTHSRVELSEVSL